MKMKHEKPSDYYCEHDGCTYKTRYEFQISKHMANKHVSHTRRVSLIMLTRTLQIYTIIKRPARDACLCMGELQAPAAPHFVFLITL